MVIVRAIIVRARSFEWALLVRAKVTRRVAAPAAGRRIDAIAALMWREQQREAAHWEARASSAAQARRGCRRRAEQVTWAACRRTRFTS